MAPAPRLVPGLPVEADGALWFRRPQRCCWLAADSEEAPNGVKYAQEDEMNELSCECPNEGRTPPDMESWYIEAEKPGMHHEPHQCGCTYDLQLYRRHGVEMWLCNCCWWGGDVRLSRAEEVPV